MSGFSTPLVLTGPLRKPAQMLAAQEYDGHSSIHDDSTAEALGLAGAPIEAPTHFSQFDPLAAMAWGEEEWFTHGCISCHFRTMVVEGDEVRAALFLDGSGGGSAGRISAEKADGTPVLTGTASVGSPPGVLSELSTRLASLGDPGPLHVIDQLSVGMRDDGVTARVDFDSPNGTGYPFTLAQKLSHITEPHPWYTPSGAGSSPWGRPVLPFEMISVLAHKQGARWPVRTPSLGLFLDMEVKLIDGPVFAEHPYVLDRQLVGLSQSRRTESYWTLTRLTDASTGRLTAEVLLHSGVFKDSYPGYPTS